MSHPMWRARWRFVKAVGLLFGQLYDHDDLFACVHFSYRPRQAKGRRS